MKQQISNLEKLSLIKEVLGNKKSKLFKSIETISARKNINEGPLEDLFHAELKNAASMAEFKKISAFSDLVDNDLNMTKSLLTKSEELKIGSVRDLALNFDAKKLTSLFNANQIPKEYPGEKPKDKEIAFARELEGRIFKAEPTASVHRMLNQNTLIVKDKNLASGMTAFFNKNTEFNIRQESILTILNKEDALIDIPEEQRSQVAIQLKTLQRITAISPDSKAVEVLYNENMHSARQISDLSEGNFIQRYGTEMGEAEAKQVYRNALAVNTRNQQAIMTMRDAMTPTGVAMIDQSINQVRQADPLGKDGGVTISYETLFGSADYCECGHCNSIYSPSAYYVELLQYIRNNNLKTGNPLSGGTDYNLTPLKHLFARRPDLKCLELTCENAYTILPYIDLSNEVMESYIALNDNMLPATPSYIIQVDIDVHNTEEDDESSTLLAQPQNIKKKAYCTLSEAVIPFSLPYNQPIDAIRIFLEELKTSRYDVMKAFRPSINGQTIIGETTPVASQRAIDMAKYEEERWDRALCAEQLLVTEQDYVVLTKEGFASKNWYDTYENTINIPSAYQTKVELKSLRDHYFHVQETTPFSDLEWVKKEFLPRTGLTYAELVDLLKTFFINPYQPVGEVKNILELINVPYRTLQSKVDLTTKDPVKRYANLIKFIHQTYYQQQLERSKNPDPCTGVIDMMKCLNKCDVETWVYYYFEKLGRMIVLESNEDLQFKYPGKLVPYQSKLVYEINKVGAIIDDKGKQIGKIELDSTVTWIKEYKPVNIYYLQGLTQSDTTGMIFRKSERDNHVFQLNSKVIKDDTIFVNVDTCDISKVKLRHLDGTALEDAEWDKMHRFIRLCRRMGWTINELDSAILGLNADKEVISAYEGVKPCEEKKDDKDCECKKLSRPIYLIGKIDSTLICQLAHIVKVNKELSLQIPTLLTFWSNMETRGEKSLYEKLFLKKNIRALDPVFEPDAMNEFLTDPTLKISEHIPAIMAGINMKADDILYLNTALTLNDQLNLVNLTILYHHQVLSRFLGLKVKELIIAKTLLGDPFADAKQFHTFLEKWNKLEDSGLNIHELQYITANIDNADKPIAHSQKDIIFLGKELHEGLRAIDKEHADILSENFTVEILRAKLSLIYEPVLVEKIISVVEGTTLYSTNVDGIGPIDVSNSPKISFVSNGRNISLKGILTSEERDDLFLTDNPGPDALQAINRLESQIQLLFQETLSDLITNPADKDILLKGDDLNQLAIINIVTNEMGPNSLYSIPIKGNKILEFFMPYLRNELKNQLIVNTISGEIDLANSDTESLLRNILEDTGTSEPLLEVIKKIGDASIPVPSGTFEGYLIPQKSDEYTFYVQADTLGTVGSIELNESIITFTALPDPTNVFYSAKIKLEAGSVNLIKLTGFDADFKLLKWKTASTASSNIPENVLVANHLSDNLGNHLRLSQKSALVINALKLTKEEVIYLQEYGLDFNSLDFNAITVPSFFRLYDYTIVRNALPKTSTSLIDTFAWAKNLDIIITPSDISTKLISLTNWDVISVIEYSSRDHFNVQSRETLYNEIALKKLIEARSIQDKINTSVTQLFEFALPSKLATTNNKEDFDHFWQTSGKLQGIYKARYLQSEWEEVVKPLNDKLRTHQRNALIAYLLNQKALKEWGVQDADSLFEFFLIDVQMEACMETSRIRQAISSVQTFIQRIFLDLENPNIKNEDFDDRRKRWDWMNRYRVWEANRKVFCYPENWVRSELRDDKSPFYKELESELLQKDVNPSMVKEALQNYLYKLDEVADMKVVGIYTNNKENRIHVVSRTRMAPYFYFYRKYEKGNWYSWEKIQVDIPSYDVVKEEQVIANGMYLLPIEWNSRLFIFFPQFSKKNKPVDTGESSFEKLGKQKVKDQKPIEIWEIKMAYSERRNEKWSQKVISDSGIYRGKDVYYSYIELPWKKIPVVDDIDDMTEIQKYEFRAELNSSNISFKVYHYNYDNNDNGPFDYFVFDGRKVFVNQGSIEYIAKTTLDNFGYRIFNKTILSVNDSNFYFNDFNQNLYYPLAGLFKHEFSSKLLSEINISDLKTFFDYVNANRDVSSFTNEDFGSFTTDLGESIFHELKKAYSLYNWELFFYLPIAIAENLNKNQQFEEAMKWYHFVFHPFESGNEANRFWKFLPFKHTDSSNYLENFFKLLQPNTPVTAIDEWRDNPFNPHIIARSRPSAYMKWVVMRYLDNILDWGDYLYRQDTLETVNYATQLYVLAGHILGKRPQQIPKRGKIKPQTYLHLMNKLDAFSNAVVDLELVFPYSNQAIVSDTQYGEEIVYANIYGLASTNYFCIPNNPKLMGYWNTISERLYNIRHCLNIQGVFRKLSLFEPEIDPALLVAATAQGLSLASVLSDMNAPVPNYRFQYMLSKAFELCNEVKSLGNTLLSTKEKKDGEILSKMRSRHEVSMNNLIMEIKKKQLEEAQQSLDNLYENRRSPVYRMKYYLQQIGEDINKIPDAGSDFTELADKVEAVLDESGLKLINLEKQELDKSNAAADWQLAGGIVETLVGIMSIIPMVEGKAQPLGVGAGIGFGGVQLSSALSAAARGIQTVSSELSFQSSNAARKAGFTRQLQDRIQQANMAGREIKQIDKQILAQKIRVQMSEIEINNHQKQIDNSIEVDEFLRNKYTNEQLYTWIEGQIKTLYYQSYKMAYDLAKKVEGLYRFERGLTSTNFIQFGYWNSAYDGLLSGEQLYNGLKQIEIAHQENRPHDYEITNKQISLRKLDPEELLNLRSGSSCEFSIPEELFDMDFPGQYKRRIKTVSFSIPCIAGPYTSISAKATLTEHTIRISKTSGTDYPKKVAEDDDRFITLNVPINAVALSSAQNDGGVFELSFKDERYMPFEGAGVVSKWKLELPSDFKQFDYNTISDVIINISYTSCEGGQLLKKSASDSLVKRIKDEEGFPQYALFDLKHDFAQEWYKAMLAPDVSGIYKFDVANVKDRLSYLTNGKDAEVTGIQLVDDSKSSISDTINSPKTGDNLTLLDIDFSQQYQNRLWILIEYIIK